MSRHVPVPTESNRPAWASDLSDKEYRWILEYLTDLNARQAALRCGFARGNIKSCTEIGSRLKRKLAANISAALTEKSGIVATKVIDELAAVGFARVTDFISIESGRVIVKDTALWTDEQKAAVSEIWESSDSDGRLIVRIKFHDKVAALDRIGKSIGLFKERAEIAHTHEIEFADPLDRINARLNALRSAREAEPYSEIQPPITRHIPAPMAPAGPIIDAD